MLELGLEPLGKLLAKLRHFWRYDHLAVRLVFIALVVLLFTLFGSYLVYQYSQLLGPPFLEISSPQADLVTGQDSVEVIGRTDPEATIMVNNLSLVLDKGGQFSVRIPVNPGENMVTIVATSKTGKTTSQSRKVTLTTPESIQ